MAPLLLRVVAGALTVLILAMFGGFLGLLFALPPGVLLASGSVHAAGDCIARELEFASKDACRAKLQVKNAMCGVVIARDGGGIIERCVADRSFAGSTVRNGGVGGRRGSADIPRSAGTMRR